jgi:amino acid adenylation domain-containing protein
VTQDAVHRAPRAAGIPRLPRTAGDNLFACSFAQERLWFLHQLDPANPHYNEAVRLRASGDLDVAAFARSLDALARRHESLRTTLTVRSGDVLQRIVSDARVNLSVVDLTTLESATADRASRAVRDADQRRSFDLARGPLFRVRIVRLGEREHVLGITAHHVIADGWSVSVLLNELRELYAADIEGRPARLAPLPIQCADVAAWQRTQLESGAFDASLRYWREQLANAPVLQLPLDARHHDRDAGRAGIVSLDLPRQLAERVGRLAQSENATVFMVLLSAWLLLLSRYCGEEDVVIGTPTANRGRAELDGVVGFLANAAALRCRVDARATFRQLLARVRALCVSAYAHQGVPFEKIVEHLRLARGGRHNPLFDSVFMLQPRPAPTLPLPGVTLSWIDEPSATPTKFDLGLTTVHDADGLFLRWRFDTSVFEPRTIERIADSWRQMIEAIVADPDRAVADYPIASGSISLATPVAPSIVDRGEALHQMFEASVACRPDDIALIDGERSLTYRTLNQWANRIAHALRRAGVRQEAPVALLLDRRAELVAAILGVLKAGGAYLPLDPRHPPARLAYAIDDTQPRVLLTEPALRDRAPADVPTMLIVDDLCASTDLPDDNVPWRGDAADAAYIIYTSGSTGRPKGTLVTHANVIRLLRATARDFGFGRDDVWTLFHSYAFDFSVWEIWGALAYGGQLIVVPYRISRSPVEFRRLLADRSVSVLNQTPSSFRQLIAVDEHAADRLPALRYVIFGGEELDPLLLRPWIDRHGDERPRLENMYGITETTVHVTRRTIRRRDLVRRTVAPIGRPIDDLQVHVFDAQMTPVPAGAIGEMYVGGAGVSRGYLRRPSLTAERFVPDPYGPPGARLYRTGDRARWSGRDELSYLGRVDAQVKIRGHRIELGEIEAALAQHASVGQAVVACRDEAEIAGSRELIGYAVAAPGAALDESVLRRHLQERLPDYMVPRAIVRLPSLPLTANGKVDRAALPAPEPRAAAAAGRAPRTAIEEIIAGVWAPLLRRESIGIDEDFFAIGGHSLLATQTMSRMREALGMDIPLRLLFELPTIADLAARIETLRRPDVPPAGSVTRAARRGPIPLSFAQQGLWFVDQWEPGNAAYNVRKAVRLTGPLDVDALRGAWQEIVRRHEVLRTSFPAPLGEPTQSIAPPAAAPMPLIDASSMAPAVRERFVSTLAASETARAFSLASGPLWRVLLVRLASDEHVLVVALHHAICDGWSVAVLLHEVSALYEALRAGRRSPLPELPIQYADFSIWQRQRLAGAALADSRAYWRRQLTALEPLRLPSDFGRRADSHHRGGLVHFDCGAAANAAIVSCARREGVTVFMVLVAAFQLLLKRWTGQHDIAVGTDIANRTSVATEPLIGCFVNQLVIRTDVSEAATFGALLARVRATTLDAYAHQDWPFDQIVEDLAPARDGNAAPLFQVKLLLQNAPPAHLALSDLAASDVALPAVDAKLDLLLLLRHDGDAIAGCLEYNAARFRRETAIDFVDQYRTLLENACSDPSRPLAAIQTLTTDQQRQITSAFS